MLILLLVIVLLVIIAFCICALNKRNEIDVKDSDEAQMEYNSKWKKEHEK